MDLRIGFGTDIHPFAKGRALRLGGVTIPFERGLAGHSDADALLHAVADALIGAVGEGDIGVWFPDTDARYRNADSAKLLAEVIRRIRRKGYGVVNLDAVIHTEKPKLAPYRAAIQKRLAGLLGIPKDRVNIKAKTAEKMDAVGRGEALAAQCVALLRKTRQRKA